MPTTDEAPLNALIDRLGAWRKVLVTCSDEARNLVAIASIDEFGATPFFRCGHDNCPDVPLTFTGIVRHLRAHPTSTQFAIDPKLVDRAPRSKH